MTRLQKTMTVIALALCLVGALAGEVWQASHTPNAPQQGGSSETASKPGNETAKEKPEEAIARYNYWLTWVTFILAVATVGLGILNFFQIRLARAEFLATHRPKIRIKHLWLTKDVWGKKEIEVSLGIVNNGTTEATLNTIGIRFDIIPTGCPIPFDPDIPDIPGVRVGGAKMPVGVWWKYGGIRNGTYVTDAGNTALQKGQSKLYCIGYVSYYDGARNMRITGFCRVLESPTNFLVSVHNSRFRKFDDLDYEYED